MPRAFGAAKAISEMIVGKLKPSDFIQTFNPLRFSEVKQISVPVSKLWNTKKKKEFRSIKICFFTVRWIMKFGAFQNSISTSGIKIWFLIICLDINWEISIKDLFILTFQIWKNFEFKNIYDVAFQKKLKNKTISNWSFKSLNLEFQKISKDLKIFHFWLLKPFEKTYFRMHLLRVRNLKIIKFDLDNWIYCIRVFTVIAYVYVFRFFFEKKNFHYFPFIPFSQKNLHSCLFVFFCKFHLFWPAQEFLKFLKTCLCLYFFFFS